ncbi:glycosyltransferase [Thomasclavelia cocleata]|uniref:Glycosyltransferase involved in cell wall bisynthesis n=1 Tax=Thomasclavelia cocleata TaxID=69824 RepID=A0A1I0GW19_9FIRM|nr:glycosyltransferase family 2 protein [Thomasclavelia cocleata]MCR1960802.1 glycosyltransferase family 2 protein [Thomasclavelia cocleata]NDO42538.1 glycosyltransferase family 2 protein [Thomasclavelia cocleata]PJN80522.1 glycosyltransferase [Thomasclavelia cocleata]SET75429.1 Glycosyltransferase involved in cell wall bisynthesis [Thomasclavelia cocleata]
MDTLAIIVPCYNEQEVILTTIKQIDQLLTSLIKKEKIANDSYVIYVNDGSNDDTWNIIENNYKVYQHLQGLNLASNVGHQNALLAGMHHVSDKCDMAISIDADLQDDINVIEQMIDKYYQGCNIIYGVRDDRSSDTVFKRFTAQTFYKLMQFLGVKSIYNHADFRLVDKRALKFLKEYPERNLFLRGMVTLLGLNSDCVYYSRKEREAGESKYPLKKMLSFAFDGITSFSIKPITMILLLGIIIMLFSIIAIIYTLFSYINGHSVAGWASLMISIWFLSGVQLFGIGLVGEYIGKVYLETKRRPRYHIEDWLGEKDA